MGAPKRLISQKQHFQRGTDRELHRVRFKPADGRWRFVWADEDGNHVPSHSVEVR